MNSNDEALLAACRRGDEAAWEALLARYQRLVYAIPRRAGLDEERAGEVFQRTFVKLIEHLERIEEPARIRAWLVTTARRETWRLISREAPAQSPADSDELQEEESRVSRLPNDDALPDEVIAELEEQHAVRLAVAAMDERCRRLVSLLFYRPDPAPYAEIAQALDLPEGSIGPTRARCLQKLRRLLKELGL